MADDRGSQVKLVKEANDIVAVVGSYLALQPKGNAYWGICPFHDDSRPSFQVDPKWQNYRCWACGKRGSVFDFVMEFEKVEFRDALELLARRAGIELGGDDSKAKARGRMLDAMRWAAELYQQCLLEDVLAQAARHYLGQRRLTGETVRAWQLGFAPGQGDWLARQAGAAPVGRDVLEQVGLIRPSSYGTGYYDVFRDRVMFPIRDVRGQVVGFGGRILPGSPYEDRVAKYYNSSDTELFKKSDLIYGLDRARQAGATAGILAVVEGYTDVLMAHQLGAANVVATMGTALTERHVRQLRRYAPRVVLVYDADQGGNNGVDRALELFVREDVDLAIATLPDGMDPCDLLAARGVQPFGEALAAAKDALDFKLMQVLDESAATGVEGSRKAVEAVLGFLALVPENAGSAAVLKRDLLLNRIARRFGLREETLRARLDEVRRAQRERAANPATVVADSIEVRGKGRKAPAHPLERELLEVLLADPALVPLAKAELDPAELEHPGLRRLLRGLYDLLDEGESPDLDALRLRIADAPELAEKALDLQEVGRQHADRPAWLRLALAGLRERREARLSREVQGQLNAAPDDRAAMELLRRLQGRPAGLGP